MARRQVLLPQLTLLGQIILAPGLIKRSAKSDNKQLLQLDGYADFNNELIDKTVIYLDSAANFSFDDTKDAGKVMNNGNNPNLFSIINNEMYSINALPFFIRFICYCSTRI